MCLFFLRSYIGNKAGVCGLATVWHGVPWHEVDGVGASLTVALDALGKAAKLLRVGRVPGYLVGAVE